MSARLRTGGSAGLGLLLACVVLATPAAAGEDAQAWLRKMVEATRSLNYDGTFVYHNSGAMQTMRIIHRAGPDGSQERLVALTGQPREVLRDHGEVTCILPDHRAVVVGRKSSAGVAGAPKFDPGRDLAEHYELRSRAGGRVAGRETRTVELQPRDEYRYGYTLAVDVDSGLLLKSELRAADGSVLEQIEFTSLDTPADIPDALLEPSISAEGFAYFADESSTSKTGTAGEGAASDWETGWLPDGFRMAERGSAPVFTSHQPVEQFVYSDGLASVSIFIERLADGADRLDGPSRMGAVNAFGRMIGDYQVTAVGEVPAATVRDVALSVRRR